MVELSCIKYGRVYKINISYEDPQLWDWYDTSCDEDICEKLGISENKFKEKMLKEFNGSLFKDLNTYFENEEDCIKAVEWLNSLIIMRRLTC